MGVAILYDHHIVIKKVKVFIELQLEVITPFRDLPLDYMLSVICDNGYSSTDIKWIIDTTSVIHTNGRQSRGAPCSV